MGLILDRLPAVHGEMLRAMGAPDPAPPADFDSFPAAVCRRLPHLTEADAVEVLHDLNLLGLTSVPYEQGTVAARLTSILWQYVTDAGLRELGWVALSQNQGQS